MTVEGPGEFQGGLSRDGGRDLVAVSSQDLDHETAQRVVVLGDQDCGAACFDRYGTRRSSSRVVDSAKGKRIWKSVPTPGSLWTVIAPWLSSTSRRAAASPMPVPL